MLKQIRKLLKHRFKSLVTALQKTIAPTTPPRWQFPIEIWSQALQNYPNKIDKLYILDGIENGFDINVRNDTDLSRSHVDNLPTTMEQKVAITEWILSNNEKQAIWGGWRCIDEMPEELQRIRVSPLGCVPKGDHFNKEWHEKEWRPIHHLSHPRSEKSVNSCIEEEYKEVEYVKFLTIVSFVASLGIGALLWCIDAKDAYLRVPLKRHCYKYMGFIWCGLYFVFTCLSFGLASACKIYTAFADVVLWIITNNTNRNWWYANGNVLCYHYLDDFFGGHVKGCDIAWRQYESVIYWFSKLGIPTKPNKCKAPATTQVILGFEYNTVNQTVSIPRAKVDRILREIRDMLSVREVRQLQLLSLIGKLRWASVCVFGGSAFVRRMEKCAYSVRFSSHHVKVNKFRDDLIWWKLQIATCANGIPFRFLLRPKDRGDVDVLTDASTGIGMGGWSKNGDWFRYRWSDFQNQQIFRNPKNPDIYWKEMCAICTAVLVWCPLWTGKSITFWCDNQGCVDSLIKKKCQFKREDVMTLIRIITNCANKYKFHFWINHIQGKENRTADALSRFMTQKFDSDCNVRMNEKPSDCHEAMKLIVKSCFN